MGRVHTVGRVVIWVYGREHLPPHFHITSPDTEALVEIATFDLYAGELPRGATDRRAMEWARANVDQIIAEWNRMNPRWPI